MLINNGNVVDGMHGVVSDTELEHFFEAMNKVILLSSKVEKQNKLINQIKEQYLAKDYETYYQTLQVLNEDSVDTNLDLFCLMLEGHYSYYKKDLEKSDMIMEQISRIPRDGKLQINFIDKVFLDILEIQKNQKENMDDLKYQDLITVWKNSDEKDFNAAYNLAEKYFEFERYEDGMNLLIKIASKDKAWEEQKAIKKLKQIFDQLGHSHNLVKDSKRRLARVLY